MHRGCTNFNALFDEALRCSDPVARLKKLVRVAEDRVAEALVVGWPALAASWEADVQRCYDAIARLESDDA